MREDVCCTAPLLPVCVHGRASEGEAEQSAHVRSEGRGGALLLFIMTVITTVAMTIGKRLQMHWENK